jgi:beta-1,4-N-acetylglucosaminyltransferase
MSKPRTKIIFVTIGATASFDALIRATLQPTFLHTLTDNGYTKLIIQFGRGGDVLFQSLCMEAQSQGPYGLSVEGFEFTDDMMEEMRVVKKEEEGREEGVVLCHAGTFQEP